MQKACWFRLPESLHPAACILLWCGWAIGAELASLPVLYSMAVVTTTAFVFPRFRHTAARLLRRSRWLMLVLLLTYAYTISGDLVWPELAWASPTVEGVKGGLLRILRLALMLVALAVLLASTERPRLIYGLYVLARPLSALGFDRRAFAVRLGLTLEYVEQLAETTPGGATQWLQLLREPSSVTEAASVYRLLPERWKWHDSFAILVALSAVLLSLL